MEQNTLKNIFYFNQFLSRLISRLRPDRETIGETLEMTVFVYFYFRRKKYRLYT